MRTVRPSPSPHAEVRAAYILISRDIWIPLKCAGLKPVRLTVTERCADARLILNSPARQLGLNDTLTEHDRRLVEEFSCSSSEVFITIDKVTYPCHGSFEQICDLYGRDAVQLDPVKVTIHGVITRGRAPHRS